MRLKTVLLSGDTRSVTSSLVEANVGIAMGSGTDVARESAGVVLIGSDLSNTKAAAALSVTTAMSEMGARSRSSGSGTATTNLRLAPAPEARNSNDESVSPEYAVRRDQPRQMGPYPAGL